MGVTIAGSATLAATACQLLNVESFRNITEQPLLRLGLHHPRARVAADYEPAALQPKKRAGACGARSRIVIRSASSSYARPAWRRSLRRPWCQGPRPGYSR